MKLVREFFAFARERYQIKLRRDAGASPPWTTDPVLASWSFCNVFREDDRTTRWLRENIRDPLRNDPKVLIATVAFRWFNLISTGELIQDILLDRGWDSAAVKERLRGKKPLVTGAFVVHSPNGRGMNKLDGLCWCIDRVAAEQERLSQCFEQRRSLQHAHEELLGFPSLGRFMAYEIITDLRWTYLLWNATDINQWASAGPGAARGLAWVQRGSLEEVPGYSGANAQGSMNREMRELLALSRRDAYWRQRGWPRWEMREVEHTLCEFDKYRRALSGERLKRKFNATQRPALPPPV